MQSNERGTSARYVRDRAAFVSLMIISNDHDSFFRQTSDKHVTINFDKIVNKLTAPYVKLFFLLFGERTWKKMTLMVTRPLRYQ